MDSFRRCGRRSLALWPRCCRTMGCHHCHRRCCGPSPETQTVDPNHTKPNPCKPSWPANPHALSLPSLSAATPKTTKQTPLTGPNTRLHLIVTQATGPMAARAKNPANPLPVPCLPKYLTLCIEISNNGARPPARQNCPTLFAGWAPGFGCRSSSSSPSNGVCVALYCMYLEPEPVHHYRLRIEGATGICT